MGLASKIVGYFFGILIVLFGIIWIMSTIPISVIVVGLIGLIAIIVGISIMYLGNRSGENKKEQELQLQ
jgi:cadmium resistance protein CadD (predicted permease)